MADTFEGHVFGKLGQLTVLPWEGKRSRNGSQKLYKAHCTVCAKDPELFGDAIFTVDKTHVRRGQLPCGCAEQVRWKKEQYLTIVKRICKEANYTFLGVAGEWRGAASKLSLQCNVDGHSWNSTEISNLMSRRKACYVCGIRTNRENSRKSDSEITSKFLSTGKFVEGTTFTRLDKEEKSGYKWNYICPVCSKDEYVVNGLCSGIFTSRYCNLVKGRLSCRCSKRYSWSRDQIKYRLEKVLALSDGRYTWVGWENVSKTPIGDRIRLSCSEHKEWTAVASALLRGGGCPACAKPGYSQNKPGFVYVLRVEGDGNHFTGYGITNIPKRRMTAHRTALAKSGMVVAAAEIIPMPGEFPLTIETEIKRKFPVIDQGIFGFMREATHSNLYATIVRYVKDRYEALMAHGSLQEVPI